MPCTCNFWVLVLLCSNAVCRIEILSADTVFARKGRGRHRLFSGHDLASSGQIQAFYRKAAYDRGYIAGLAAAERCRSCNEGYQVALAEILTSNQALRSSRQTQQPPLEGPQTTPPARSGALGLSAAAAVRPCAGNQSGGTVGFE